MNPEAATPSATKPLLWSVYFIYFFCGMTQAFEGVILPEFKELFQSTYLQQMLIMLAKNLPFAFALGIGFLIPRVGYKQCLSLAMICYAVGTLLLVPGLKLSQYWLVLLAFFVIGTGFNIQLVAGNPLLSALGPTDGSASRLNLGNALGAVAQIIAPATLAFIIPAALVNVQDKLPYITRLFLVLGVVLWVTAIVTTMMKPVDITATLKAAQTVPSRAGSRAWAQPRVLFGFFAIFLTLGAEAILFSNYRNYLLDAKIVGMSNATSLQFSTLFMAVFAAGRLAASWVQKRLRPATTLIVNLVCSLALLVVIMTASGKLAIIAVTAIGFFVSIFFPTLYALIIEGMGEDTAKVSGLLTMGFLGCAFLPVFGGWVADKFGLRFSYLICAVAYMIALQYTFRSRKRRT